MLFLCEFLPIYCIGVVMIVKCVENRISLLPSGVVDKYYNRSETDPITIGQEYVVYALSQFGNSIKYCVFDIEEVSFPVWCISQFFEIVEPRLSRYWIYSIRSNNKAQKGIFLGFLEWVNDPTFYNDLIEAQVSNVNIFSRYKQLMDLEFPRKSITELAKVADEKWLMCPNCIDAWENSDNINAMVVCPKCRKMFHNPRYDSTSFDSGFS